LRVANLIILSCDFLLPLETVAVRRKLLTAQEKAVDKDLKDILKKIGY